MAQIFYKKEAIKHGWGLTKKNISFLLRIGVPIALLSIIFNMAGEYFNLMNQTMVLPFWVLSMAFHFFISIGAISIVLKMNDGKDFEYSDLWGADDKTFINYVLGSILYCAIVIGGLILLIIPGIYWAIKYSQIQYLIIDKKMKPREALRKSAELTKGSKWNLLFFMILLALVNILGVIVFGVGLLWSIPTTALASVYVYRKLDSKE